MNRSHSPSSRDGTGIRASISPVTAGVILAVVLALGLFLGYRWSKQGEVTTEHYVRAAKYWIEKPVRDRLQAQGLSQSEIDTRVKAMWNRGELKLPPGKPGVDWAGTPMGIMKLPPRDLGKQGK